jgi:hypothetical protein
VLPDALLSRAREGWDMRFDPQTLAMIACPPPRPPGRTGGALSRA